MKSIYEVFKKDDIGVEIGVYHGSNAVRLMKTLPKRLYLIDCWEEQDKQIYNDPCNMNEKVHKSNYMGVCKLFKDIENIRMFKMYSEEALPLFEDHSLDWIYIDGNHGYESTKKDILMWHSKVKMGGWISGHDWSGPAHVQGVHKAVLEVLGQPDFVNILPKPSWILKKTREL